MRDTEKFKSAFIRPSIFIGLLLCVGLLASFGCSQVDTRGANSLSTTTTTTTATTGSSSASTTTTTIFNRLALLRDSQTFMYQIAELEAPGAIAALAATEYPMIVIEPTYTVKGMESFDVQGMINSLRRTPSGKYRIILAYVDIGEAENYRTYWVSTWEAPVGSTPGNPDFIIHADPDGWSGNYPVAYWDARWKAIWLGSGGLVEQLAHYGFDGIYMDWVEAYDYNKVIAAATVQGKDPAGEMFTFIHELRVAGQAVTGDFLVVAQNSPYLIDENQSLYTANIDALAEEDTWFSGSADADWNAAGSGDIPNTYSNSSGYSTSALLAQYEKYKSAGLPVFTIDYCTLESNAFLVTTEARAYGLRPLVTRVSLSQIPNWR